MMNPSDVSVVDEVQNSSPVDFSAEVQELRKNFTAGVTESVAFRESQLQGLLKCFEENSEAFLDALYKDLKKSRGEARLTEVEFSKNVVKTALFELRSWMAPTYVEKNALTITDTVYYYPQPYGVALIIAPWNFPLNLLVGPLVGAIAAGNCVVVKPSEVSAATAAAVEKFFSAHLDKRCFKVICGGVPETTALLNTKFDHIFYTGGGDVGKIVAVAAARNLTPVTLELGGKSPVYIDRTVDMDMAAKRIMWGKTMNAGQICIAPDYLLCTKEVAEKFVEAAQKCLKQFYGDNLKQSPEYGRIINARHFKRLEDMISSTTGEVVLGGSVDESELYVSPTIIMGASPDDTVMQTEIFGPVLPIVFVDNAKKAVEFIKARPQPLALYVFTSTKSTVKLFKEKTSSGALSINEVGIHFSVEELPFGGIGDSGMGKYRGKFSFDAFSNNRAVLHKSFSRFAELAGSLRYPPLTEKKVDAVAWLIKPRPRFWFKPSSSTVVGFMAGVVAILTIQAWFSGKRNTLPGFNLKGVSIRWGIPVAGGRMTARWGGSIK